MTSPAEPRPGEERPGTCGWCQGDVVLVWRLYEPIIGGGYWSTERCGCINGLSSPRIAARFLSYGRGLRRARRGPTATAGG